MDFYNSALALGKLLEERKAEDVVVIDLREYHTWTDFFVIGTVSSAIQAAGIEKYLHEEVAKLSLEEYPVKRKVANGEEWSLIDLGGIVVHLMSPMARKFYDLEKLWFEGKNILTNVKKTSDDAEKM
ncbi:ribosome silencing factor [Treponema phagedenis]|uniref:ribosome silencing factor n=1 Tax=Treponema phagedenis TaxID=162 RepID=UPI0011E768BB|nr:ribosome silencing factor [Treponema phagedenis]QEK00770.1 ribosome silencing factor [Treponema phagedenis]